MTQEVPGYVRASIEYTVATAYWQPSTAAGLFARGVAASTRVFVRERLRSSNDDRGDYSADLHEDLRKYA
jgi:hypothetical protein